MGQILALVVLAALPTSCIMPESRGAGLAGGLVALMFAAIFTTITSLIFWGAIVPRVPFLARTLGRPSFSQFDVEIDPTGIAWLVDRPVTEPDAAEGPAAASEIRWLDPDRKHSSPSTRHSARSPQPDDDPR